MFVSKHVISIKNAPVGIKILVNVQKSFGQ